MRFNKLDLNLLVALDALLTECSISRAATRVHLSQSAMSNALARLRAFFGDELLVPVGRTLELTPRARALKDPVRDVLVRIDSTIAAQPKFDPMCSERSFQLLVSDYTTVTLLPHLLALARRQSPTVRFLLCPLPHLDQPARALGRGEADLLVVPRNYCSADHPVEVLFEEEYVCVVWNDSRFARAGVLTHDDYVSADEFGIERRVEVRTFSFVAAPFLVLGTDRIATVQRRLARMAQQFLPLTLLPAPVPLPRMEQSMQWHSYRRHDPALAWVRGLMHEAVQAMDAPQVPASAPAATTAAAPGGTTR